MVNSSLLDRVAVVYQQSLVQLVDLCRRLAIWVVIGLLIVTGLLFVYTLNNLTLDRHARALPSVERYGSKLFVHGSFEEMTLVIESVVGRRMDVEEALRRAG